MSDRLTKEDFKRMRAVELLTRFGLQEKLGDPHAFDSFVEFLSPSKPIEERLAGIYALTELRDKRAIPHFEALLKDRNPEVRETVAYALGALGFKEGFEPLKQTLKDSHSGTRYFGVTSIGRLAQVHALPEDLTPTFIENLNHPEREVRHGAAETLAVLRDQRAVKPMLDALNDPKWGIEKVPAFNSVDSRFQLVDALAKILGGKERESALLALFRHSDRGVRNHAIYNLRGSKSRKVMERVTDMLNDSDRHVCNSAASVLAERRYAPALPHLKKRAAEELEFVRKHGGANVGWFLHSQLNIAIRMITNPKFESWMYYSLGKKKGEIPMVRGKDYTIK